MTENRSRKGIILAGGSGTRLYPSTRVVSKQLLPVYDKPMIYYPLSTLMLTGIKSILLISTLNDIERYKELLESGEKWGIKIEYCVQKNPDGLAQALILAEDFLAGSPSTLILGDNIFYGHQLSKMLSIASKKSNATIFGYHVNDPERYGVVNIDTDGKASSIEEKPIQPKSNYAVVGLYFYDENAPQYAKTIKPSQRGELEITDLNKIYLSLNNLEVVKLDRGIMWLDSGTQDSLLEASSFVASIQKRQGRIIGCPEEIAFQNEWIDKIQLSKLVKIYKNNYGEYLASLLR